MGSSWEGSKTTLIVAPVSIIQQWKSEIIAKTSPPLKVYLYYGSSRSSDITFLQSHDVIITTYSIVGKEFPFVKRGQVSEVFSLEF